MKKKTRKWANKYNIIHITERKKRKSVPVQMDSAAARKNQIILINGKVRISAHFFGAS